MLNFKIDLSKEELSFLINLLGERPYKQVANLLIKIDKQVIIQEMDGAKEKDIPKK